MNSQWRFPPGRRRSSGWHDVDGEEAAALESELRHEMPAGHALRDRTVRAVARRFDRDDVAFEVDGSSLCIVHLTWRAESDPHWPSAHFVEKLPDGDDDDDDNDGD